MGLICTRTHRHGIWQLLPWFGVPVSIIYFIFLCFLYSVVFALVSVSTFYFSKETLWNMSHIQNYWNEQSKNPVNSQVTKSSSRYGTLELLPQKWNFSKHICMCCVKRHRVKRTNINIRMTQADLYNCTSSSIALQAQHGCVCVCVLVVLHSHIEFVWSRLIDRQIKKKKNNVCVRLSLRLSLFSFALNSVFNPNDKWILNDFVSTYCHRIININVFEASFLFCKSFFLCCSCVASLLRSFIDSLCRMRYSVRKRARASFIIIYSPALFLSVAHISIVVQSSQFQAITMSLCVY